MKKTLTRITGIAIVLACPFLAFASNPMNSKSLSGSSVKQSSQEATFLGARVVPGTLVVKVKPEFRPMCSPHAVQIDQFQKALTAIRATDVSKKFPSSNAPVQAINRVGKPSTDLSLIYQVHFSGGMTFSDAIRRVVESGVVVYAEPLYLHQMDYTPNDPQIGLQYQNAKINLYTAWDVWKGDTNTVIGIVDSGTDWDHPDLAANIKYNYADPIDGIDNDGDGFIDNYRGWDVSENDNNPMVAGSDHGSHVSGCADAVTDNSVGVAGPGFRCRFLPVKVALDASTTSIDNGYDGLVYAADHGVNVINCSWGRTGGPSMFEQEVINYVTIDKDVLVLAAAGNNGLEQDHYPSSYDRVISVAATNSSDVKAGFSNFGYAVDVCAPGDQIYSTVYNDTYTSYSGTSMASPIAAGCAAMIKSRWPAFHAEQVGEQLRITADNIYGVSGNTAFQYKLGKGRVNLYRAMTDSVSPGVVVDTMMISDGNDNVFVAGDTLDMTAVLKNLLRQTTNLTCTLTAAGTAVTILNSNYTAGVIATLDTASNYAAPFRVVINATAGTNTEVRFRLTMNDGTWTDFYAFKLTVNVDYINIDINDVATSITSKSLTGYNSSGQIGGIGFTYMGGTTILYEMGLMVGATGTQVSDNVRGDGSTYDSDFASVVNVSGTQPGSVSDFDAYGKFRDNGSTSSTPMNIQITHHAYAWMSAADRKYIMVQYMLHNAGSSTLSNLYAGIFSDWDIPAYGNNKGGTDNARKMGYVWSTDAGGLYGGVKLLSAGGFNNYVIDNLAGGGGGADLSDGYSNAEKYTTLSTFRADGGNTAATGNDIIDVVSAGPFNLAVGDSVEVTFALLAGENLGMMQASADAAQTMYDNLSTGLTEIPLGTSFSLSQSYPNPTGGQASVTFTLDATEQTQLNIYNLLGEKVKTVVNQKMQAGKYTVMIDVSALPEGHYLYRLQSGTHVKTLPMTIVR